MNSEAKTRYFKELTFNLQHEGLTVKPETEDSLLPVELDGQRLCRILDSGAVRYWGDDIDSETKREALDKVIDIAKATAEYMSQLEAAPLLTARGLTGDYRLLTDFNDTVLAGHPTEYGVQFITWDRTHDRTALNQGRYYGPGAGISSYAAAKQDFAARSGLIPRSALFTPEQLIEMYCCIHETLESAYPLTDERRERLESAAEQIDRGVPNLEERVELPNQKELNALEQSGMQFC